jgi:acyl-CoA reductase-like NAD-dependent aldehyde dehydrogenase
MQQVFEEAGVPQNVVQYFHSGSPVQLEAIIRSPEIQHVCFTGSVAGGLAVKKAASDRVAVGVGLELGGKDPAYIRSDVDVKWAAGEIVDGAVFNSGQSCCSVERVYVSECIHDEFVTAVQDVLKDYVLGDPFDKKTHLGPVVSKRSADTIKSHVNEAVERGAKNVTPKNDSFENPPSDGNFVPPAVLINVTHEMIVMKDETFGPVIPIMKVKDDKEAVALMNDSQFGLTASIWTKDVAKGHELAEEVDAGTVFVNRCDFPSPVSTTFSTIDLQVPENNVLTSTQSGPGMDRLEGLWQRPDAEPLRIRPVRQAEELPHQRLPQVSSSGGYLSPACHSGFDVAACLSYLGAQRACKAFSKGGGRFGLVLRFLRRHAGLRVHWQDCEF